MKMYKMGGSEYAARVMGLARFLLHCDASNVMLEILKHDKIWGQLALAPPLQVLGGLVPSPLSHVICVHVSDALS